MDHSERAQRVKNLFANVIPSRSHAWRRRGIPLFLLITMLSLLTLPTGVVQADEVDNFIKKLTDKEPNVREGAAAALGGYLMNIEEKRANKIVQALANQLSEERKTKAKNEKETKEKIEVRRVAANSLTVYVNRPNKSDKVIEQIVPKLGKVLVEDEDATVRGTVSNVLSRVSPKDIMKIIPQVVKTLITEDDVGTRDNIKKIFDKIKTETTDIESSLKELILDLVGDLKNNEKQEKALINLKKLKVDPYWRLFLKDYTTFIDKNFREALISEGIDKQLIQTICSDNPEFKELKASMEAIISSVKPP